MTLDAGLADAIEQLRKPDERSKRCLVKFLANSPQKARPELAVTYQHVIYATWRFRDRWVRIYFHPSEECRFIVQRKQVRRIGFVDLEKLLGKELDSYC